MKLSLNELNSVKRTNESILISNNLLETSLNEIKNSNKVLSDSFNQSDALNRKNNELNEELKTKSN